MKTDKLLLERIKKDIKKAEVVSFDIFDTLLVRPYIQPTDLFVHMEKAYDRAGFAAERRDAERRTRIRHRELEDITLDMIYDEIDDEFKDMKRKEMDWEAMVLRANPELKQVYDYAKETGKKIVIASDMYLPTEFLAKVLRREGFDGWDKLYVSGDLGKKKGTGSLYYQILEDLGVAPKQVLHIGDNKRSDVEVAQELKIKTVLYQQVALQFLATSHAIRVFQKQTAGRLDSSILVAILAYRWQQERCGEVAESNYWQNLGFRYAGPVIYGYCRFIEETAKEEEINNLLFVARDGYSLQKVFNTFENNISNSYVYAPRILNLICTLDCNRNYVRYLSQIVDFYCKFDENLKNLAKSKKLETADDYNNFILENSETIDNYASVFLANYRKSLLAGIVQNGNVGIVDTMTTFFSAQNLIEKALGKKIPGFYWATVSSNYCKKYKHFSWADGFVRKNTIIKPNNIDVFTKNWFFIEFLISSPEHPIEGVDMEGNTILQQNPNEREKRRAHLYQIISDEAVVFAEILKDRFGGFNCFFDFDTIIKWVNCFIEFPSLEDIKNMTEVGYATLPDHSDFRPLFSAKISLGQMLLHPIKTKSFLSDLRWKTGFQKFFLYGLYHRLKTPLKKYVKFFGVTWASTKIVDGIKTRTKWFGAKKSISRINEKRKYFLGVPIFSEKRKDFCNVRRILGIKVSQQFDIETFIRSQNNNILRQIEQIKCLIRAQSLHEKTFAEYRNKFCGKDVVLICTGPTAKFFDPLSIDGIYVGVNGAIYLNDIPLDYLFVQDRPISRKDLEQLNSDANVYEGRNCRKFYGIISDARLKTVGQDIDKLPPSYASYANADCYYLDPIYKGRLAFDLSKDLIADWGGTAFSAMQFIFYTNPKRIFLVGCDASSGNAVKVSSSAENAGYAYQRNTWLVLKRFADKYYPDTEIISVNPVGLKGMFSDVYTRSYLNKHPELYSNDFEII